MDHFELTDLPKWYVDKHHIPSFVVAPADTFYLDGLLPSLENVTSLTFAADGSFLEEYVANPDSMQISKTQVDKGRWLFNDSIASLQMADHYPNRLIYSFEKDQLATDKFQQTAILQQTTLAPFTKDTVTYTIRTFYKRSR